MTVSTFTQPDFTAQSGTAYKTAIDDAVAVLKRHGNWFGAHEQASPNMTVRLDAGFIFSAATLTEVAAQSTGTITAPVTNPRIDRVVVDSVTGAVSVVAGTEAASPSAPAIPAGKLPVARVLLATSTTQIENPDITDERAFPGAGGLTIVASQAATGTSVAFTGLPAGIKMLWLISSEVSMNATGHFRAQIGDADGLETTGYNSAVEAVGSTVGFVVGTIGNVASAVSGMTTLVNRTGTTWNASVANTDTFTPNGQAGGGVKTLGGTGVLDRVTVSTNTGSYDNGVFGLAYIL